jgi:hypothetical protein
MGQLLKLKHALKPTTVQMANLALFETSSTSQLDLIHIRLDLIQSRNTPEGRQMKQYWITYVNNVYKRKNKLKIPL